MKNQNLLFITSCLLKGQNKKKEEPRCTTAAADSKKQVNQLPFL